MKAQVIIENGKTSIKLTPENNFEADVLEKAEGKELNAEVTAKYQSGMYSTKERYISIELLYK